MWKFTDSRAYGRTDGHVCHFIKSYEMTKKIASPIPGYRLYRGKHPESKGRYLPTQYFGECPFWTIFRTKQIDIGKDLGPCSAALACFTAVHDTRSLNKRKKCTVQFLSQNTESANINFRYLIVDERIHIRCSTHASNGGHVIPMFTTRQRAKLFVATDH